MPAKSRLGTLSLLLLAAQVSISGAKAQSAALTLTPQMTKMVEANRALLAQMNLHDKDGRLRMFDDPAIRPLVDQAWELAGKWAAAWFDLHPNPSPDELGKLFIDLTPPPSDPRIYDPNLPDLYAMEGLATRLASDLYLVRAVYQESQAAVATSTFFVVSRDASGHFAPKWSIKPLAMRHYHLKDEIGRWAFLGSCAYYCGPLVVSDVIMLPPSDEGLPRFAVDAYQATNGNTLMKQLSFWQWEGDHAKNLLIRSYAVYVDEKRQMELAGGLLSVPTKETTRSFSSFGCCVEPRGVWTIRILPHQVRDFGHRFVQPQIQWADRLIAASGPHARLASGLASPHVYRILRHVELGTIIDRCEVLASGKKGAFEIYFAEGDKLWFAYELRNGHPYFTRVKHMDG